MQRMSGVNEPYAMPDGMVRVRFSPTHMLRKWRRALLKGNRGMIDAH